MAIEQLNAFHLAKPFKPFVVFLGDGQSIRVDHPELLAHAPNARTFAVWNDDVYEVVDLLLVTSLKPTNGSGRRGSRRSS